MEIVFSGICCWVDAVFPGGKTVIIRNALNGGAHNGVRIPPHYAFIHAKRSQVDDSRWPADWGSQDDVLFWLTGDRLTIDPTPRGGDIDISMLPHVAARVMTDPICSAAEEIRPGYIEEPTTAKVLALLDLPGDADVRCGANEQGAAYAVLRMPSQPVTITAAPFDDGMGETRSLTITDSAATVLIVNVNMPEYITGLGAQDDDHKYLVCEIFQSQPVDDETVRFVSPEAAFAALEDVPSEATAALCEVEDKRMWYAAGRQLNKYLDTLAGGCSASQWP